MKIYVVTGHTGEYSDRRSWMVRAFTDEQKAKDLVIMATRRGEEIFEIFAAQGRKASWAEDYESPNSPLHNQYDPKCTIDYTGVYYGMTEVELDDAELVEEAVAS